MSTPGIHQVRRYFDGERPLADVIYDVRMGIGDGCRTVDVRDFERTREIPQKTHYVDLLEPIFEAGQRVYEQPTLNDIRTRCLAEVARLSPEVCRLVDPERYAVGLEAGLAAEKQRLLKSAGK